MVNEAQNGCVRQNVIEELQDEYQQANQSTIENTAEVELEESSWPWHAGRGQHPQKSEQAGQSVQEYHQPGQSAYLQSQPQKAPTGQQQLQERNENQQEQQLAQQERQQGSSDHGEQIPGADQRDQLDH